MLVTETSASGPYAGDGVVSRFNYGFKIFHASHLLVTHTDALDVETVLTQDDLTGRGYALVTGVGNTNGGTVSYTIDGVVTPLPAGEQLLIERLVDYVQETDLRTIGAWTPETHEDAYDYLTMQTQQLARELARVGAAVDDLIGSIDDPLITGVLTNGRIPLANGAQSLTNSVMSQSGTVVTLAGNIVVADAIPRVLFDSSSAIANEGLTGLIAGGNFLSLAHIMDDSSAFNYAWTALRSGITPSRFTVHSRLDVLSTQVTHASTGRVLIAALDATGAALDDIIYFDATNWVRGTITDIEVDIDADTIGTLPPDRIGTVGGLNNMALMLVLGVPTWQYITVTIDLADPAQVTGILPLANGGTNKNLTAVNGGILWTDADSVEVSAAGTSGQLLRSAGVAGPTWTTPTYPETSPANGTYMRGDGTNVIYSTLLLPNAATANRVPFATGANEWGESANFTFDGSNLAVSGLVTASGLTLAGAQPTLLLNETDASADERLWSLALGSGVMTLYLLSDALAATAMLTIDRVGATAATLTSGMPIAISNTAPQLYLIESGATANEGAWVVYADGDEFRIDLLTDALGTPVRLLTVPRTGTTPDSWQIRPDVNFTTILGRTRIDARITDRMYVSHFDMTGNTQFALLQTAAGVTNINGVTELYFTVDGNVEGIMTGSAFTYSGGYVIANAGFGSLPTIRTTALSGDVLTVTDNDVIVGVQGEGSAADNFDEIAGGFDGQEIYVYDPDVDVITMRDAQTPTTGRALLLHTPGGTELLSAQGLLKLKRTGTVWRRCA